MIITDNVSSVMADHLCKPLYYLLSIIFCIILVKTLHFQLFQVLDLYQI